MSGPGANGTAWAAQKFGAEGNMLTLSEELNKLRQADAHIADALRRIGLQQTLAASLPAGSEKIRAEALLETMRTTLTQFNVHRESILANIARLREEDGA
jgi:hypothetical protein